MNNSYKKAMDKIELSDELKEKIIKTALEQSKSISPKNNYNYIKRLTEIAACFIICLLSVYTVTDRSTIYPIEIVSEKSSEIKPTMNTDRTSEKNVVKKDPVQNKAQNTPSEKKTNTEDIPDSKIAVSTDNINKSAKNSSDLKIAEQKTDTKEIPDSKIAVSTDNINKSAKNSSADSLDLKIAEQKTDTKEIPDSKIAVSADNINKPMNNSTDNDEKLKTNNTDNETIKPKQDIETEKNPSVTNSSLPPYVTGKKVVSENNNTSNTKTDIKQLTTELGYEIKSPQNIPKEYNTAKISVVDKNIAEITYQSETDTITYRTTKNSEDMSSDDNDYTDVETVTINDNDVTIKGNNNLYYNAEWFVKDETFSIYSDNGLEKDIMIDIVKSVN